ncbi:MAG: FAD-dependent oxidoreductase [Gemmatimonadetes bacterium]|nr:FAD-dependent oxidoreductase [Gemmatimonadota bacterium]HCK10298.1 FAD-dependent oxidoreductase [Candidatus Latescibacterota bacterium]
MAVSNDIVVIGAGVIGVCTAYELTRRGHKVTLIDQGDVCAGSSYGNAGLVVPSHCVPLSEPGIVKQGLKWMLDPESPFYIKPRLDRDLISWLWKFNRSCTHKHVARSVPVLREMHLNSLSRFETFAEQLSFSYEHRGSLYACNTESGFETKMEDARIAGRAGIRTEVVGPEEIAKFVPETPVSAVGGVFYPEDAHLQPAQFVRAIAEEAQKEGAQLRCHSQVIGFKRTGRRISRVQTTRGDASADLFILTAGSWSPMVAAALGFTLPIQPAKGYSITFKRPPNCPSIPIMMTEAKVGVTPMADTFRFAGTLELAGLDLTINQRRVRSILSAMPSYFPELSEDRMELIEIWRGLRPCTPDGLPLLGRTGEVENLIVGAGHATIGISLGPESGAILAKIVDGEDVGYDPEVLSPERF